MRVILALRVNYKAPEAPNHPHCLANRKTCRVSCCTGSGTTDRSSHFRKIDILQYFLDLDPGQMPQTAVKKIQRSYGVYLGEETLKDGPVTV